MDTLHECSASKSFGGWQKVYSHVSESLNCTMRFGIYLPPKASEEKCPILYWLSGLTCNEENFIHKSGFQRFAAEHNVIVVTPDTSPRGEDVPDDPSYDLGCGAGFYVNATQAPWNAHFHMYDYIVHELPALVEAAFPVLDEQRSILGHSMGGHGALMIALKNPERYRSVSAFAPILAPSQVPWGKKIFQAYLGTNEDWELYDSTSLIQHVDKEIPLLIDQGAADPFLEKQLRPELFEAACRKRNYPFQLRLHEGYDHSYYFIATFVQEHIEFHMKNLF